MPCIHLVVRASIIHLQYSTCIPEVSIFTVVMYGVSNACSLKVTCIQYYLLFDDSDVNFERYELEINIMSMTHAIWIILLFQRLLQFFFYHLSSRLLYARNFPQTFKFYVLFIYIPILSVAEFKMCLTLSCLETQS